MADKMTPEQFDKLFMLDPDANKSQTYSFVDRHLNSRMTTFDGKEMDFDFIYNKYKSYCEYWHRKNSSKDPKYISSKDKRKDIISFIANGMYDSDFGLGKSPRDFYMMGNLSFNELDIISKKFNSLIAKKDASLIEKERPTFKPNYEIENNGKNTETKDTIDNF